MKMTDRKKLEDIVAQIVSMCLLAGAEVATAYRVGAEFAKGCEAYDNEQDD